MGYFVSYFVFVIAYGIGVRLVEVGPESRFPKHSRVTRENIRIEANGVIILAGIKRQTPKPH
jgi:hypothetical protein